MGEVVWSCGKLPSTNEGALATLKEYSCLSLGFTV